LDKAAREHGFLTLPQSSPPILIIIPPAVRAVGQLQNTLPHTV